MALPDLLTLNEYKSMLGVPSGVFADEGQVTALLGAASRAVRAYTDRRFEIATGPATDRVYAYDGSGFLEIDDCTSITSLSTDAGVPLQSYPLDVGEWTPKPERVTADDDPYYYILIHGGRWLPASPEMGFERNLDTLGFMAKEPTITVTATWGWPTIPDDVKLAVAWSIKAAVSKPDSDDLQSEAIAGYARSWARQNVTDTPQSLALPRRARDLLDNYARPFG